MYQTDMTQTSTHDTAMALLERWEAALRAHDVESLTGTYADHATLDSPFGPPDYGVHGWPAARS